MTVRALGLSPRKLVAPSLALLFCLFAAFPVLARSAARSARAAAAAKAKAPDAKAPVEPMLHAEPPRV